MCFPESMSFWGSWEQLPLKSCDCLGSILATLGSGHACAEEVFKIIDEMMYHSKDFVRILVCDGEACNRLVKNAIFGDATPDYRRKILDTKYFSHVHHRKIAGLEGLPRFPLLSATVDGEAMYFLPGTAHACKNAAAQISSSTKIVHFGMHAADASGLLSAGLPLPAYSRKDPMSDRLSSLLANPMYLIGVDQALWLMYIHFFQWRRVKRCCMMLHVILCNQ